LNPKFPGLQILPQETGRKTNFILKLLTLTAWKSHGQEIGGLGLGHSLATITATCHYSSFALFLFALFYIRFFSLFFTFH
jgi:hypothetical protein